MFNSPFNSQKKRFVFISFLTFALTLASSSAYPDDTEIYFTDTTNRVSPNLLLILDTSGSMGAIATGDTRTRLEVLKDTLNIILAPGNLENVNLGLMRFTNTRGGSVLFPISPIDDPTSNIVSEPTSNQTYRYYQGTGANDGQELLTPPNTVSLSENILAAGTIPASGATTSITVRVSAAEDSVAQSSGDVTVGGTGLNIRSTPNDSTIGLRFAGLIIPQGATITAASLELTTERNEPGSAADLDIAGHDVDHSSTFSPGPTSDVSLRTLTSSETSWTGQNDDVDEQTDIFPTAPSTALVPIIQEIVDRPGWGPGNALSLIVFNATEERSFHGFASAAGDDNKLPTLNVTYTSTPTPAVDTQIGLHFPQVNVPQGATVTNVRLIFSSLAGANGAAAWEIDAEISDDSPALSATASDISSRTFTGSPVALSSNVPPATPVIGQIPDPFDANTSFVSPDLTSIVKPVIDRSGWCGGNAMTFVISGTGTRYLHSYNSNPGQAPRLQVTYDRSGPLGCSNGIETTRIAHNHDDTVGPQTTGDPLSLSSGTDAGLRFQAVDIPRGATITGARITLTAEQSAAGTSNLRIRGQLDPDPVAFGNISDASRMFTAAEATWTASAWTAESAYMSPDLQTIVQTLVNQAAWSAGNAMVFRFQTNGSTRDAYSYDGDPAKAARLEISYSGGGTIPSPIKTVRERGLELINEIAADGFTPIVSSLYEAARYWRGESVEYGRVRDNSSTARLSHPGSYCVGDNICPGADTTAFPPYGIDNPVGCTSADLDASACLNRTIEGSPRYISPFYSDLRCAQNYQVLLTDGLPDDSAIGEVSTAISNQYLGGGNCRTQLSNGNNIGSNSSYLCGSDLTEFLRNNDQNTVLDGDQTVITFTIAYDFSPSQQVSLAAAWLEELATVSGGQSFLPTTATALRDVFDEILSEVVQSPTSIVAPSLSTNAFNRLFSRDEVYFGLFTPSKKEPWDGNVKKYQICTEVDSTTNCDFVTRILDANGDHAVNANDRFDMQSQSFWSDVVDGVETTLGGTGGELTDYRDRLIYTDTTSTGLPPTLGTSLNGNPYNIDEARWNHAALGPVRNLVCPSPSTVSNSDCNLRMFFMLGRFVNADPVTDTSADTRWVTNDVLHSSPVIITYGGSGSPIDTFFDKLVYGTNDGGLRMLNSSTGQEDWTFLPQLTLAQQRQLWDDAEGPHMYGIDSSPVVNVTDVDEDGIVEPADGDTAHVYFGMRRGGRALYALDLTPTNTITNTTTKIIPKFLWRIVGGTPGTDFEYLADTWSIPKYSTILTGSGRQDVLIFGGGYDQALDNGFGTNVTVDTNGVNGTSDENNNGNMIFIVNPANGDLIFSIGGANTNATLKVPEMQYSIAASPAVLDTSGDGNDDRIYIADTGGQIWRVDLADDIALTGANKEGGTVVGRLADIGTEDTTGGTAAGLAAQRRFFEIPEIAAIRDVEYTEATKSLYYLVTLGSGDRANPLNTDTHDRFYAFRDFQIGTMIGGTGADAHVAQDYPLPSEIPLDETRLIDVSATTLSVTDAAVDAASGWYIDLRIEGGREGEKVFSSPVIVAGNVFFTTYSPESVGGDLCAANVGGGRLIGINVLSSAGFITDDVDGRTVADDLGGLASGVIPFYSPEGIYGLVGVEGGVWQATPDPDPACTGSLCTGGLKLGENAGVLTYWSEQ